MSNSKDGEYNLMSDEDSNNNNKTNSNTFEKSPAAPSSEDAKLAYNGANIPMQTFVPQMNAQPYIYPGVYVVPNPYQQQQQMYSPQYPVQIVYPGNADSTFGVPPVSFVPSALDKGSLQDHILSQEYEVNTRKWFSLGLAVFKQHWFAFILFTLFQFCIAFIPYFGTLLCFPLAFGIFIATSHKIRGGNMEAELKYDHFFHGFLFYVPILFSVIIQSVLVFLGLMLCIIPGLYVLIVLSFAVFAFLEYHEYDLGVIGSLLLSQRVVKKRFFEVTAFLILNTLFMLSGLLLCFVGILITYPIANIVLVFAFRDMFGLNAQKQTIRTCVCC